MFYHRCNSLSLYLPAKSTKSKFSKFALTTISGQMKKKINFWAQFGENYPKIGCLQIAPQASIFELDKFTAPHLISKFHEEKHGNIFWKFFTHKWPKTGDKDGAFLVNFRKIVKMESYSKLAIFRPGNCHSGANAPEKNKNIGALGCFNTQEIPYLYICRQSQKNKK